MIRNLAFDLHPVRLCQLPARITYAALQDAVIRQQQEALRIMVEPPSRVDAGPGEVVRKYGAAILVAELAEHPEGLVEKDEARHWNDLDQQFAMCLKFAHVTV
jgi:hypothetical protein